MSWTKLDDDTVTDNQPLSAFVGKRITDNTNSYATDLTRLSTFAYPTTAGGSAKVKWAAYERPRGTFFTVDVGINAINFIVKVFYRTTNAALGGQIFVRHADSGTSVLVAAPGSAAITSLEVPFTTSSALNGLQGFYVGWISDVSAGTVGAVEPVGAVGNQVFCEPATGTPFPFTLAAGTYAEMYHLLKISSAITRPAPSANALLNYQICAFKHNSAVNQPPEGVLLIWPELEINPAILPTDSVAPVGSDKIDGDLYELGRIELFSISIEVYEAKEATVLPPYPYQQTTPINELDNRINSNMMLLQPNAATLQSSGGFLGCLLPAGTAATFAFFVQTKYSVQQLITSFQAVTYNAAQDSGVDITFGVRDYSGTTVGTDITKTAVSVPRYSGQTTRGPTSDTMIAMNGVLAGDENWGMRDGMTYADGRKGTPVTFIWGPNVIGDFNQAITGTSDAVYYGTITATSDLYIYGFNCRLL